MDEPLDTTALLLVQARILSKEMVAFYQQEAQAQSCRLLGYVSIHLPICPKVMAKRLADHLGLDYVDLESIDVASLPLSVIPKSILGHYPVIPLACQNKQLYIAVDDPSQQSVFKDIQFLTGYPVIPLVAATTDLSQMRETLLRETDHLGLSDYLQNRPEKKITGPLLSHTIAEAPIVAFVHRLLYQAIAKGASDLHFESYEHHYQIRYRQDGILHELATPPPEVAARIAARLKIMAALDSAERRLPQDGGFSIADPQQQSIDCRFSSCPTLYGEKIVVRILNNGLPKIDSEHLGLSNRDYGCLKQAISRPQGLILVTGPTGSGKTVTLHAALSALNTGQKNISSLEDPIEIKQAGINQVPINPKIGLNFSTALRALLRQDPDVIMVGEIRDYDTADMAIKASHTGHLVLSSLHTNNSAETIIRLQHIGIPTYLLSSALSLIIAQRLIRKLCPYCKIPPKNPDCDPGFTAQGCHRCQQGYMGRMAVFEVMPISQALQELIIKPDSTARELTHQAQREGMLTLRESGFIQIQKGVTSFEEIQRVL